MIDTDKYENITPERWTVDEDDPFRVVDVQDCTIARTDFVDIDEEREWQLANAQLIADAPFLLAEVKRLRGELESIENDMAWTVQGWQKENYMGRQDWMEQMCEIYTDLAKGIEAQYYGDDEE